MKKRVVVILAVLALLAAGVVAARVLTGGSLPMPEQAENVERTTSDKMAEAEGEGDKSGEEAAPENSVEEPAGTPVTMAEAPVFTTTTEGGFTVTAPDAFLQTQELADVESAAAQLSANGNAVCVALVDLETRRGLWLNADELMYPASSIKAAYCLYLFEANSGSGGMSATVEDALVNSSNDSYRNLYFAYGLSGFEAWLGRVGGISLDPYRAQQLYPDVSANALAAVWEEFWRFMTSDSAGASELAGYLSRTTSSPIGEELRDTCDVWSKPGWYPLDEYDIPATNDAGVIDSETGPYAMVILTDVNSDLESIKPLIRALDAAHTKMCGDDVAYYEE